jgi:SAM-dependent methyltransferase
MQSHPAVLRHGTAYSADYFDAFREGALASARVVVPMLEEWFRPRSVVDVGCGSGAWLAVWREHGVTDILGIDGPYVDPSTLLISPAQFQALDLRRPFALDRKFDLALCLEVAEHLPARVAASLVRSLINLAPIVLFSAAVPLQTGAGHINERWPNYWRDQFAHHDYMFLDPIRPRIWHDARVEIWYRQNIFLAVQRELVNENTPFGKMPIVPEGSFLTLVETYILGQLIPVAQDPLPLPQFLANNRLRRIIALIRALGNELPSAHRLYRKIQQRSGRSRY